RSRPRTDAASHLRRTRRRPPAMQQASAARAHAMSWTPRSEGANDIHDFPALVARELRPLPRHASRAVRDGRVDPAITVLLDGRTREIAGRHEESSDRTVAKPADAMTRRTVTGVKGAALVGRRGTGARIVQRVLGHCPVYPRFSGG